MALAMMMMMMMVMSRPAYRLETHRLVDRRLAATATSTTVPYFCAIPVAALPYANNNSSRSSSSQSSTAAEIHLSLVEPARSPPSGCPAPLSLLLSLLLLLRQATSCAARIRRRPRRWLYPLSGSLFPFPLPFPRSRELPISVLVAPPHFPPSTQLAQGFRLAAKLLPVSSAIVALSQLPLLPPKAAIISLSLCRRWLLLARIAQVRFVPI